MIAAEKLLRIALFSDELQMTTETSLTDRRKKLAGTLRALRKKGVIPVFVSTLWFLVALGISIDSSFGNRGNTAAHDLAVRTFRSKPFQFGCSFGELPFSGRRKLLYGPEWSFYSGEMPCSGTPKEYFCSLFL